MSGEQLELQQQYENRVLWTKMGSHPWWPSQACDVDQANELYTFDVAKGQPMLCVLFLGANQYGCKYTRRSALRASAVVERSKIVRGKDNLSVTYH